MSKFSPFFPSRAAGLAQLHDFVPRAGSDYARMRNYDFGPQNRANVSQLSRWLRHRLITEEETLSEVLSVHSPAAAEKFVQEVCWRTYWKGWLEMRPRVWSEYRREVSRAAEDLGSSGLNRYESAISGKTGIECFDSWWLELCATGYLHNHARMWFASIWIFTLELPWSLGADFFLRHLIDGDAASNTLSWRWVAGLQTVGKTYLARSDNIAKFTGGRFPSTRGLAEKAAPEVETAQYRARPLVSPEEPDRALRTALLLTDDDLCPEDAGVDLRGIEHTLSVDASRFRSSSTVANGVTSFVSSAFDDAEQRAPAKASRLIATRESGLPADDIVEWCRQRGIEQLVSAWVPVGPSRDALSEFSTRCADAGIAWRQVRRSWDRQLWPYATKGFFNFKKHIPSVLERRGIVGGQVRSA